VFQLGVPVVSCPQYNFSVRINRGTAEPYWSTGRALLDSSADWYREQPTLMSLWPLPVTLGPSPLARHPWLIPATGRRARDPFPRGVATVKAGLLKADAAQR